MGHGEPARKAAPTDRINSSCGGADPLRTAKRASGGCAHMYVFRADHRPAGPVSPGGRGPQRGGRRAARAPRDHAQSCAPAHAIDGRSDTRGAHAAAPARWAWVGPSNKRSAAVRPAGREHQSPAEGAGRPWSLCVSGCTRRHGGPAGEVFSPARAASAPAVRRETDPSTHGEHRWPRRPLPLWSLRVVCVASQCGGASTPGLALRARS